MGVSCSWHVLRGLASWFIDLNEMSVYQTKVSVYMNFCKFIWQKFSTKVGVSWKNQFYIHFLVIEKYLWRVCSLFLFSWNFISFFVCDYFSGILFSVSCLKFPLQKFLEVWLLRETFRIFSNKCLCMIHKVVCMTV